MIEIKSPNSYIDLDFIDIMPKIFLGGSIEMGTAQDWQKEVKYALEDHDVVLLNPRRDNWDSSWEQTIENPEFKEQVTWELDGLDNANIIIFYFDPNTKSPITLMELGLMAIGGHVIVCCPDGFWRKGNVEILCERFKIPLVNNLEDLIKNIKSELLLFELCDII